MKALGTLPSLRTSRNPLVTVAVAVVVIFAAYKAAESILADDISTLAFVAIIFVGGAVTVAILNDWRRGLYLLFAWILFEDFVRKYLDNNMAIYFLLGSAIVFSAWQVVVKLRGTPWFPLAFTSCLYAILLFSPMMFVGSSAYQDYVLNAYFWLLLGILFRLQFLARAVRINSDEAIVRQA